MNKEIAYYVTFIDANGHEHYAIHMWNRISGIVTTIHDYMF